MTILQNIGQTFRYCDKIASVLLLTSALCLCCALARDGRQQTGLLETKMFEDTKIFQLVCEENVKQHTC